MIILRQELRYAIRLLLRNPGFTSAALLSIALGIGANTLIFSVVNSVLIRPLPYRDPSRLAVIRFSPPKRPAGALPATTSDYITLREHNQAFEDIGAVRNLVPANFGFADGSAQVERISGQQFSAALSRALGVNPLLGRWFTEVETRPGASPVVVISYHLWQSRFGSGRDILGKTVNIDGKATPIIGVMPKGFVFFDPAAEFWVPLVVDQGSSNRYLWLAGRLKGAATLRQAQDEMNSIAAGLAEKSPNTNQGWGIRVIALQKFYVGWVRKPLLVLQGVVAFVLLIACANVAGLLLTQATARSKEAAVRTALGASRWHIVRQYVTESVLLSFAGGVLSIGLAYLGLRVFILMSLELLPRVHEIALDNRVLALTILLSSINGLVVGVIPALRVSRSSLIEPLKESNRAASAGRSNQRVSSALVVLEMSLALVLLIGAGLLIKTFLRLYTVSPGFNPTNVAFFQVRLPRAQFLKSIGPAGSTSTVEINPRVNILFEQICQRLREIPGVQSAAAGTNPPLWDWIDNFRFAIEAQKSVTSEKDLPTAEWFPVSAGYFHTLGIPLLRGRDFAIQDSSSGLRVAIINETMARHFWADQDPIGKRVRIDMTNEQPREIIGVVGDVRPDRSQLEIQPQVYVPYVQQPLTTDPGLLANGAGFFDTRFTMTFIVRASGDPQALVPRFRAAVAGVDRNLAMFNIKTLAKYASEELWLTKLYMTLLSTFSGMAAVLALIGIYGITAYSVQQRTHEIGIRMALGASPGRILRLVIRRGFLLIVLGTVLGLTAALALTRLMQSLLWGVTATDPLTFCAVIVVLATFSLLACYMPARRALTMEPTVALRHE